MSNQSEPKLAPPGAGLPVLELFIGRLLFAWQRRTGHRDVFNARFQQERERIRGLVQSSDEESLGRRMLIRRVRGLEDSSRYWSVWMTLDHLRIVHEAICGVIEALAAGVVPAGQASTADVKPCAQAGSPVVADYERSCDALLEAAAAGENSAPSLRYNHPWFGPLDAAGWHAMAAVHIGIHRIQIERIIVEQKKSSDPGEAAGFLRARSSVRPS